MWVIVTLSGPAMPDSFNLFISMAPSVKFKVYDLQYYLLQCMKLGQHRTNLQLIPQIFLIIFKQSIFSLALKEWPSEQEGGIPDAHTGLQCLLLIWLEANGTYC